ncbi:MAG: M14 family zinc carboxypeptidase [Bacteroidales bacterium]
MKKTCLVAFASIMIISTLHSQIIKSPGEFLGYDLGTQFTFQYRAVEYFKYIASISPLAKYREYGTTNEGRTLGVCFISSQENLANLEEYRKNNLIKAGLLKGEFTGKQIPFIWLAYNVHGNEAVGMEAAMKTLYTLVSDSYPGVSDYLKECVIVIDPCQNPDGHDLYTNRYRNTMNSIITPDGKSWEHNQGWPSARTNHYLFDLNRDWTWQTQTETQQRQILYNQFMPQVYADFHEMGVESTFFFAPGADPWNTVITPWQHEFHKLMGNGTANLFNEKFKLYFTKENFDLFYPSYGDTWPIFNGAVGFTFEQGGGGPSGLAYKLESGDTLTLKDRIDGHFTASMATIKVSCENREKLLSEYNKYFDESVKNPQFHYKSVIIKGSNEKSNIKDLLKLLDRNQIRYNYAGNAGKRFKGFDYSANKEGEVTIEKGDILVSAYQPQSHFVEALFEPSSKFSDSLTYDITAWALPYVYNLKAFAIDDKLTPDTTKVQFERIINEAAVNKPYAYVANFRGFDEIKLMAALFNKNIKVRYSLKPFILNGNNFNRGSLIVARGDNKDIEVEFDKIAIAAANECQVKLVPSITGLVDSGKDFGSEDTPLVKKKSVAVLCGDGTSSSSVGEVWYFFEKELNYPLTLINPSTTNKFDLKDYEVLILTSGKYSKLKDTIIDYVKRGGRVVAIENAISVFAGEKSTSLAKAIEMRTAEQKLTEKKIKSDDSTLLKKFEFENEKRYDLSDHSIGSIYKVRLDETDPYAFGLGKEWFIMKRSAGYPFLATGSNIGYILDKEPVSGFAGFKYKDKIKNTLVIGTEKIGSGEIIYITDDPYFRAFWKSGRVLLGNAVLR